MSARRIALALFALGALGALLAGCAPIDAVRGIAGRWQQDGDSAAFYDVGSVAPGRPGEIVRSQALVGPPAGSRAWRILYHSTDQDDRDIVVSGIVVMPTAPSPPSGRAIVSWAHPTTGVAPVCAPSRTIGGTSLIPGLHGFLAAGDVVAAADYPGLGVANPSSYLIGRAEGRSVLDAARAARNLIGSEAGTDLLLWGHSQGGQAALFAAQEQRAYAPELRLRALAVAAPASDLAALLRDHLDDLSGVAIGSYAYSAYAAAYDVPLDGILTAEGIAATPSMTRLCLLSQVGAIHSIARPLVGGYTTADPGSTEPWASLLAENTPGGVPIGVPILVAQGLRTSWWTPPSPPRSSVACARRGSTCATCGCRRTVMAWSRSRPAARWRAGSARCRPAPCRPPRADTPRSAPRHPTGTPDRLNRPSTGGRTPGAGRHEAGHRW
ncbi:lipase family protein [Pseudolysinimonas sp.]|uniref:lipase family protein n=1 Tax=Pseudolysinimonas sp. TaxID=2680009 RepID=UPI003F7E63CA